MKIQDDQSVASVKDRNGNEVPFYDNGYGPLWLYSSSCGNFTYAAAAVRAENEADAWEIVEDEFLPECDLTMEEIIREYGFRRDHVKIMRSLVGLEFIADGTPIDPACVFVRWDTVDTLDPDAWLENPVFQECCTLRPNGARAKDVIGHGIAWRDINGDFLRRARADDNLVITLETEQ